MRSIVLPILVVLLGGILLVAFSWLVYLGITLAVEALFYAENPTDLPQDALRNLSALSFCLLYLLFLNAKTSDLVKSTVLVGPLSMVLIALILRNYMQIGIVLITLFIVIAVVVLILIRQKKPWIYFVATGYSLLLAVLYAWPAR
jgi:hypothetical protein